MTGAFFIGVILDFNQAMDKGIEGDKSHKSNYPSQFPFPTGKEGSPLIFTGAPINRQTQRDKHDCHQQVRKPCCINQPNGIDTAEHSG